MAREDARALLGRLAGTGPDADGETESRPTTGYGRTIDRATAVLDDLDDAAAFVDDGGVERLEAAVERAEEDLSDRARAGRRALETFRTFETVARDGGEGRPAERPPGGSAGA